MLIEGTVPSIQGLPTEDESGCINGATAGAPQGPPTLAEEVQRADMEAGLDVTRQAACTIRDSMASENRGSSPSFALHRVG